MRPAHKPFEILKLTTAINYLSHSYQDGFVYHAMIVMRPKSKKNRPHLQLKLEYVCTSDGSLGFVNDRFVKSVKLSIYLLVHLHMHMRWIKPGFRHLITAPQ